MDNGHQDEPPSLFCNKERGIAEEQAKNGHPLAKEARPASRRPVAIDTPQHY